MFKTSLTTCKIQIKVQILTKNLILKHLSIYCMIYTISRYDTIHTIHTLYRTIYEHLQYADTIQNFLHMIQYDTYRTILTTMTIILLLIDLD